MYLPEKGGHLKMYPPPPQEKGGELKVVCVIIFSGGSTICKLFFSDQGKGYRIVKAIKLKKYMKLIHVNKNIMNTFWYI